MNKAKKILSIFLTAMLATSCVPMSSLSVNAASELSAEIDTGEVVTIKDTDGDSFYEIGTADELYAFATIVHTDAKYDLNAILTDDIVITENTITADSAEARVWTPICQEESILDGYSGTFDGNGKTISGLYFNDFDVEFVGLFGKTRNASVKDLTIENSYFAGMSRTGGIVGLAGMSEIENCVNEATVESFWDLGPGEAGGIVGNSIVSSVKNCVNTGTVSSNGQCGGIVGSLTQEAEVISCSNYGKVEVTKNHRYGISMGGIVGAAYSSDISESYNYADIIYDNDHTNVAVYMGGITGYADSQMGVESVIDVCANLGNIIVEDTPASSVGGIVAELLGSRIKDSYNEGNLTANANYVGGISAKTYSGERLGNSFTSTVQSCLNLGDCSSSIGNNGGITGWSEDTSIANCFYLEGTAEDSVGTSSEGVVVYEPLEAVDEDRLASGEITYILNQGNTAGDQKFYQTLGEDPYPSFTGKTVYYYIDEETGEESYYNETIEECEHNYVDGYCEHCGEECEHNYIEGTCEYCGVECEHYFVYGYCEYCGEECEHNFSYGYCEICSLPCEHNFENSICTVCGSECEHNYIEGICEYCAVECDHYFTNGICDHCYMQCEHNFVDGFCANCGLALFKLNSAGLTISDDIGVNLVFQLNDVVVADENAYFEISVPTGTKKNGSYELAYETQIIKVTDAKMAGMLSRGYMVTCNISAKELSSDIITVLHLSDGTTSQPIVYQAKQYVNQVFNPNYPMANESVQNLVVALVNYGASAQEYFDYNTENLANSDLEEAQSKLNVLSGDERTDFINDNKMTLNKGTEDKVKYYGSSLLLEDRTVIRHYFTLVDPSTDISTIDVTVNGAKANVQKKGNFYYVDIEGVTASSLDVKSTLVVDTMSIEYSGLSYAASVINAYTDESGACTNAGKAELVNLAYSLNDYFVAAGNIVYA